MQVHLNRDVQIKYDRTRTIKFPFHLYLFKSSRLSIFSYLTKTRLFDFRLKQASAKVHGFSQCIGNVFPIVAVVSIYVQKWCTQTYKLNSIAPRRFEILTVRNDRGHAIKQRKPEGSPQVIYDSTIDVYDREDFGKALRRYDVQIIPAAPLLLSLDVSSLVVCFLLFRLDDPRKTKQFGGSCRAWRAHRRDSISQGCSMPLTPPLIWRGYNISDSTVGIWTID